MSNLALRPSDVTVIILNYRNAGDTIACLQAIYAMPDASGRVIVADNDSQGNSLERIVKAWECLTARVMCVEGVGKADATAIFVALSENAGYATGNNAGVRLASTGRIWVLCVD